MSEVTWRLHPLYTHYEFSSDGRARSIGRYQHSKWVSRYHELKPKFNTTGYRVITAYYGPKRLNRTLAIHIGVCEAFHGLRPSPKHEVRHLNGNKLDNRQQNLAWGTHSENIADAVQHGTHPQASKTHCPQGHEYTPENTYDRRPYKGRTCRACMRLRRAARRAVPK